MLISYVTVEMEKRNSIGNFSIANFNIELSSKKIKIDTLKIPKIRIACPKTSAILERLGDNYRRDAKYGEKQELLDYGE